MLCNVINTCGCVVVVYIVNNSCGGAVAFVNCAYLIADCVPAFCKRNKGKGKQVFKTQVVVKCRVSVNRSVYFNKLLDYCSEFIRIIL